MIRRRMRRAKICPEWAGVVDDLKRVSGLAAAALAKVAKLRIEAADFARRLDNLGF